MIQCVNMGENSFYILVQLTANTFFKTMAKKNAKIMLRKIKLIVVQFYQLKRKILIISMVSLINKNIPINI